jgi:two-component system, OmpR family, response regulator
MSSDNAGRLTCLIIEDHGESASLLEVILRSWRIETHTVSSAAAARSLLEIQRPDVIVCDLKLATEDGLSFIRWLRSRPSKELARIPAIAVTANYELFSARDARESGFDLYLTKPLDLDDLPHQIMLLVGQRKNGR